MEAGEKMDTGKRLRNLREERGLSQEDVAKAIGVGRVTYLKYENGENRPVRKLKELSAFFNVSIDYLLGNDTPAQSEAPTHRDMNDLPALPPKDERQIAKDLENIVDTLNGAAAMSDDPEDEEDREMLKAALLQAMTLSKRIAKKKFTPKKYRREG